MNLTEPKTIFSNKDDNLELKQRLADGKYWVTPLPVLCLTTGYKVTSKNMKEIQSPEVMQAFANGYRTLAVWKLGRGNHRMAGIAGWNNDDE